jgi:uncharacterized membrane protein YoaK (UPF0700 family)
VTTSTTAPLPLHVSARRVVALTIVCGFVEVIGYRDAGGIYPAIMTGNTVQLGWSLAEAAWSRFALFAWAIGAFFVGCMIASLIRRRLRRPPLELGIMALLLVATGFVRVHPAWRVPVELPMLALALAMQGQTISRFGGVSLQTLVVTSNMAKFSDAFIGRYVNDLSADDPGDKRPAFADVLLPGLSWLTYSLAAAAGAIAAGFMSQPLVVPAVVLVFVSLDLRRLPER